nr:hypothetical protein [Streptomyces sp. NRRL F-5755]
MYLPDGIDATRDPFAERAPVEPDEIRASRSYPGHGPKPAFDKPSNAWWGPGVPARADRLDTSALPHRVKATVAGKDGPRPAHSPWTRARAGSAARSVSVRPPRSASPSSGRTPRPPRSRWPVAEIELFGRHGADQS